MLVEYLGGGGIMVVVRGCTQLCCYCDWGRMWLALVECPSVGIIVGIVDGLTHAAPLSGSVGSLWVMHSLVIFVVRTPHGLWLASIVIAVVGGARCTQFGAHIGGVCHPVASSVVLQQLKPTFLLSWEIK